MNSPATMHDPAVLTRAHVIPFAVFMAFLLVLQLLGGAIEWRHPDAPWWRRDVAQLIYPIQSLAALGVLVYYWRYFTFQWSLKWSLIGVMFGIVGISCWLLPSMLHDVIGAPATSGAWYEAFGVVDRSDGFNPGIFDSPAGYWASLVMRFFRAAVIVALVEEIFWRGFLMRFVLDWEGNYWKQPFGKGSWKSYLIVTGLFVIAHHSSDYAGAIVYGSLTYVLCIWSKNLGACVCMHAAANFLMGVYIMHTGKFGLW
jgi:CAAX prenyl protease-like protein